MWVRRTNLFWKIVWQFLCKFVHNFHLNFQDTIYSTKIADKNLFEDLKAQLKKIVTEIQVNGSDCLNEAEQWGKAALSTGCVSIESMILRRKFS